LVFHERFNLVMFCAVPIQVMDFQRKTAIQEQMKYCLYTLDK
jgi:hypothetical protein